jgi:hypothetical protein
MMNIEAIKRRLNDLNKEIQDLDERSGDSSIICAKVADRFVKGVLALPKIGERFEELALMREKLESKEEVRSKIKEELSVLKKVAKNVINKVGESHLEEVFLLGFDDIRSQKQAGVELKVSELFDSRSYILWDRDKSLLENLNSIHEETKIYKNNTIPSAPNGDKYLSKIIWNLGKRLELLWHMLRGVFELDGDKDFVNKNLAILDETLVTVKPLLEEAFVSEPRSRSTHEFEELYAINSKQKKGVGFYYQMMSSSQCREELKRMAEVVTKELIFYLDTVETKQINTSYKLDFDSEAYEVFVLGERDRSWSIKNKNGAVKGNGRVAKEMFEKRGQACCNERDNVRSFVRSASKALNLTPREVEENLIIEGDLYGIK